MINHPKSLVEKMDEKKSLRWWKKIKALLFEQWLQIMKPITQKNTETEEDMDLYTGFYQLTVNDWVKAVDTLALFVQNLRKNLELKSNHEIDIELLGISTYLFHIDRLLVKVHEYFKIIRTLESCQEPQNSIIFHKQIRELGEQCHQRILNLISLIQELPIKKLYTDQFISQVHTLELEVTALGSAIRTFNQNAYKAQAMLHLSSIEKDLLQAFQTRHSYQGTPFAIGCQIGMHTNDEYIRSKINFIADIETKTFMSGVIDIYQMLKKCYVIPRKSVIKESIDKMAQHIESLVDVISQKELNKNQVYYHFNQIFHCIESLRFSTNTDNHCSKNLFNKSKIAYLQLRKLCEKNPIGLEYLKQYSIKRIFLKPK